jgi:hypothetical protein
VAKHGMEARLYAPMIGGIALAGGCFWYGFTSVNNVHWIVPCIGLVIIIGMCGAGLISPYSTT